MQSFELPKSTVSPPKPLEKGGAKSKSPRQGKKHGVSSLVRPLANSMVTQNHPQRGKYHLPTTRQCHLGDHVTTSHQSRQSQTACCTVDGAVTQRQPWKQPQTSTMARPIS
ncbi:hypothetical protein ElyMa_003791400 [Elysia marginata]|uniref:Uncharacterized protein n=1 Tax=Elysia marginata TaxID=1093978 RepID=A0AAV4FC67_9GAST|nr:hypothetical protein ElyMa_003791400 [Elysia marginata]